MVAVWYKLYHFPGEEEIQGNVGIVRMEEDRFVAELSNAIYQLHARGLGTASPTDLYLYPFGTDMPVADASTQINGDDLISALPPTTRANPLLVLVAESSSNISKRKLEALLETTQLTLSESKASQKLKTIKHLKCCFLCGCNKEIEASHVIQKSDISFKSQSSPSDAVMTLELSTNWMKDPKWARPFEIHGPMNLIWLCHTHNLSFDRHDFCLKIDLNGNVLFHAFGPGLENLVEKANARLLDRRQTYYSLDYISKRAVGMRIMQAQLRRNRYLDHKNPSSWQAVVDISLATSEKGADDEADDDVDK